MTAAKASSEATPSFWLNDGAPSDDAEELRSEGNCHLLAARHQMTAQVVWLQLHSSILQVGM